MEVTFGEARLAAVCNSKYRMVRRWGHDGFEYVGRRLLELAAAADLDCIATLPGAAVTRDGVEGVTISFDRGELLITAQLVESSKTGGAKTKIGSDGLHVVGFDVRPRVRSR